MSRFEALEAAFSIPVQNRPLVQAQWDTLSELERNDALIFAGYVRRFRAERNLPPMNAYTFLLTRWWKGIPDGIKTAHRKEMAEAVL